MRPTAWILAALFVMPVALAAPLPSLATHTCSGTAPSTTDCTTGTHTVLLPQLDVAVGATFTGSVDSILVSDTGEYGYGCSYREGQLLGCVTWGVNVLGPVARHVCRSTELGSNELGGAGEWTCLYHDVV